MQSGRRCQARWCGFSLATLALVACGPAADATRHEPPPRAHAASPSDPALPVQRPTPFSVELRRRRGATSMLLRVADDTLHYTVGEDPHAVTLVVPLDPATIDELYATLRQHEIQAIDTRANPEADVDGTSIRMVAGRRSVSAVRMGQFEPEPQSAADYDACVQALLATVPRAQDTGVALAIVFDPSMAERRASVEIDAGPDLIGLDDTPPTIHVRQAGVVHVKLRYGPPDAELETDVDLARTATVRLRVDPERNVPQFELVPRAQQTPP